MAKVKNIVAAQKKFLRKPVGTLEVKLRSVSGLLQAMSQTGFQGKQLGNALDVWEQMIRDPNVTIYLGYSGSMSTTGQWKLICWLLEHRYIDVLVSTGANISEDIVEGLGYHFYQGSHTENDVDLLEAGIDRYYDVYVNEWEYREMEYFLLDFFKTVDPKKQYSSAQFLHEFGKYQQAKKVNSITATAAKMNIPVYSPGMADSSYGESAFILYKKFGRWPNVDQMKDFVQMGLIAERANRTPRNRSGVIFLGGGVPKDTIQILTVMVDLGRGISEGREIFPHKYAIQITQDSAQWGGLSGCTFEEAISWGKIDAKATRAVCYCEITIALPLLVHGLNERLKGWKRKGQNLGFVFRD